MKRDVIVVAGSCSRVTNVEPIDFKARNLAETYAQELEILAEQAADAGLLAEILPYLNASGARCVSYARQIQGGTYYDAEQRKYVPNLLARIKEGARKRTAFSQSPSSDPSE